MAEMPQSPSAASSCRSAGSSRPSSACSRICVSRFSIGIPPLARLEEIVRLVAQERNGADQVRTGSGPDGKQARQRMPVPRDENSLGRELVHQSQALLPEVAD